MTAREQAQHAERVEAVKAMAARLGSYTNPGYTKDDANPESEDLAVAESRLLNWVAENEGRWVRRG